MPSRRQPPRRAGARRAGQSRRSTLPPPDTASALPPIGTRRKFPICGRCARRPSDFRRRKVDACTRRAAAGACGCFRIRYLSARFHRPAFGRGLDGPVFAATARDSRPPSAAPPLQSVPPASAAGIPHLALRNFESSAASLTFRFDIASASFSK
jgi:hypothetical protein